MKDAGYILRQKYFERLNNVISYTQNGKTKKLKVYDSFSVPVDANPPYIVISSFNSSEIGEGSKQSYGLETYITIDIVTKFLNGYGGAKSVDDFANSVIELVRTRSAGYFDLSPDFQVINVLMENTQALNEIIPDGWIARRIIRFSHKLIEL